MTTESEEATQAAKDGGPSLLVWRKDVSARVVWEGCCGTNEKGQRRGGGGSGCFWFSGRGMR